MQSNTCRDSQENENSHKNTFTLDNKVRLKLISTVNGANDVIFHVDNRLQKGTSK